MTEGFDQASWDERYRTAPALWSGQPNPNLVAETEHLVPGVALDVGCGEGADALWLAKRGWRVTGIDISAVALDRAREAAAAGPPDVAARIVWQRADLLAWAHPSGAYDLVNAQYFHLPQPMRATLWTTLLDAVAPGGTLLVVAHDLSDPTAAERAHHHPERFFPSSEVTDQLSPEEWTIVTDTIAHRRRTGVEHQVNDLVVRAVRRHST